MNFSYDTYIVLDVPSPIKDRILDIRKHHKDTLRASLPVEITVAGSSGVGVIEPGQDKDFVFDTLTEIATKTRPIAASFSDVFRFPGSEVFVLTLKEEERFRDLHQEIMNSGIQFKANPFPYKPHCTLRSRSPITDQEEKEIMKTKIRDKFIMDTLSVYMVDKIPINRLFTVKLTGEK